MKKEFFLNIIFLLLANILIKPFYLLWVEVDVNNIVGPSAYGTYAGIFSMCYIFQIIADPGLLNFNTTQIAANKQLVFERFPLMLGLKLFLALLFIGFVFIVANIAGYEAPQWKLLPWITANILLISLNLFLRSNVAAMGQYRWDSFFSILDKLLMIICLLLLIYVIKGRDHFEIIHFVQGQCIAFALTTTVLLLYIGIKKISIIPKIDFSQYRTLLKKSIPYAWLLFLMTVYTRVDSFMLERLISDDGYQAGVYASAFRLFDAGNSFAYLFAVLLLPILTTMLSNKEDVLDLVKNAAGVLFTGIIALAVFGSFWSSEIMALFYPEDHTIQYHQVFILLLVALVPLALSYVTGTLLVADNKMKALNKMAAIGVVVNIVLNLILLHQYQAVGTAIATAITQWLILGIQLYYLFRFFPWKIRITDILLFLAYIGITILLAFIVQEFSPLKSWVNFAVGIIISLISALYLGLIRFDFFQSILKNKHGL